MTTAEVLRVLLPAALSAGATALVTIILQARRDRVLPLKQDAREAAKHILEAVPQLEAAHREAGVRKLAWSAYADRWRSTWQPYRHQLSPELRRRLEAQQAFLDVITSLDDPTSWGGTLPIMATVNVTLAAEAEVRIQRYPPSFFPDEPEMKELVDRGLRLGTGGKELVARTASRMSALSAGEQHDKYKRGVLEGFLIAASVILVASLVGLLLIGA